MEHIQPTPDSEDTELTLANAEHVSEVAAELAGSVAAEGDMTQAIEEANKQLNTAGLELVKQPTTLQEKQERFLADLALRKVRARADLIKLQRGLIK
jgi:ClpP class serine protease